MYINIHTHNIELRENVCSVVNFKIEESLPDYRGLYSIGIHPWEIRSLSSYDSNKLLSKLSDEQAFAIGEIGLDKLAECDMALQIELFKTQIEIANRLKKPIIIHCVKAFNELLLLKREIKTNAIIHGFRGKPQLMKDLCKAGFFISFGEKFNEDSLKEVPMDRLFLETDDAKIDIQSIYQTAAKIKQCDISILEKSIEENFQKISHTFVNI